MRGSRHGGGKGGKGGRAKGREEATEVPAACIGGGGIIVWGRTHLRLAVHGRADGRVLLDGHDAHAGLRGKLDREIR